ncbi:hypothetical protein GWK47_004781 [Chionoecetes opilio]|uniref:Reverse transcriptase domain-containing protein n=1 Tax=Chionoecetes opilio TaxID=41210 RepID=A0A8J4YD84_CHIOP|nr:hypothetical protein GWK47_004781 [Chionoecetes opilio]
MDWVLGKVVDQSDSGASLSNTKITDLVFADDAVIFDESLEVLVMALEALHEEAKPLGLEEGKGDRQDCNNYRGITLLSVVPGKVLAHLLLTRIRSHLLKHQRPQQFGFTPGKSTTDLILALRVLVERRHQSACGAFLGNTKIADLICADDAVIFAESLEVLVMALEALHEEAKLLGFEVSWIKTKVQRPKGFKARFLSLFDNMDFLMATAIHPLFKLPVVHLLNPEKVDAVKSRLLFEVTEQAVLDTSEGSSPEEDEEDDFFKALRTPGPTATEGINSTCLSNKMGKELESWCSEKQRCKVLVQAMFPALSRAA